MCFLFQRFLIWIEPFRHHRVKWCVECETRGGSFVLRARTACSAFISLSVNEGSGCVASSATNWCFYKSIRGDYISRSHDRAGGFSFQKKNRHPTPRDGSAARLPRSTNKRFVSILRPFLLPNMSPLHIPTKTTGGMSCILPSFTDGGMLLNSIIGLTPI